MGKLLDPSDTSLGRRTGRGGRDRRIAMVGAGALGSELCRLLIEQGHRHVTIVDPDVLEPANLRLSPLFRAATEGVPWSSTGKAELIVRYARLHAGLAWRSLSVEIADVGLAALRPFDLLVSCPDSALARVETAFAARTLRLPMLDGAVHANGAAEGRVAWYPAGRGAACYLCGLPESRRADLLAYAASLSLGCAAPPESVPLSGAPAAVSCTAAALLRHIRELPGQEDQGDQEQALAWKPGSGTPETGIELPRSASCPWHDLPSPDTLVSLPDERSFAAALRDVERRLGSGSAWILELPWPICPSARCRRCGTLARPMRRTALVRRRGVCARCDARGQLDPLESIAAIRRGDPWAEATPQQLGLPSGQLFSVRQVARPLAHGDGKVAREMQGSR